MLPKEIETCLEMLKMSIDCLKRSENEMTTRYHWSAFLKHYRNSAARLIGGAMRSSSKRGPAHRYKNIQKTDRVLAYLTACRNSDEHYDEKTESEFHEYGPHSISFGESVSFGISKGVRIIVERCIFHDHLVNVVFDWQGDMPKFLFTGVNTGLPIKISNNLHLSDVTTRNGKVVLVPIIPEDIEDLPHIYMAKYAMDWIKQLKEDLGGSS